MSYISAMSYCLPPHRITNEKLEKAHGWSVREINDYIGVKERRSGMGAVELGYYAAKHLLDVTGAASDIRTIIFCSESNDIRIPCSAAILQHLLGLSSYTMCFDLSIGCTGFPYAVKVASSLGGNVLIINSDTITSFTETSTLQCLHGDAAAATIITDCDIASSEIRDYEFGTEGSGWKYITLFESNTVEMDGASVGHFVLNRVYNEYNSFRVGREVPDLVLFHQANRSLLIKLYDKLKIPEEKRFYFIENVGNLSNASTPVTLYEAFKQGRVAEGDLVHTVSFGAGLSWGILAIECTETPILAPETEASVLIEKYGRLEL